MRALALALVLGAAASRAETPVARLTPPCESSGQEIGPDGAAVAVSCTDGTLALLAIPSGKHLHQFAAEPKRASRAFSPDGRRFAIGYWTGKVRVVPTTGEGPASEWQASDRRIQEVRFLPGGTELLVVPLGRDTQLWRLGARPRLVASLASGFAEATALAVSSDGKHVVAATGDTELRFYEPPSWKQVRSYRELTLETFAIAFTPDQKQLLVGGADKQISVLDAATGKLLRTLPRQADPIRQLLPLGDGDSVVALYFDAAGKRPPQPMLWSLHAGTAQPLVVSRQPTGGGLVRGELWFASTQGRSLEIWKR